MTIVIDGIFFQIQSTGIARVWRSLLEVWSRQGLGQEIIVLDRAGSAPDIPGIRREIVPAFEWSCWQQDPSMLQVVCDRLEASVFLSTYYTFPTQTPSVLLVHDLIPEVLQADLSHPMWQQKQKAIAVAKAFITISHNTARDLIKCYPSTRNKAIDVAWCGLGQEFYPPSDDECRRLKQKYGIVEPYLLWVGERLGFNGYKNSQLLLKAAQELGHSWMGSLVFTGKNIPLEPQLQSLAGNRRVHTLALSDDELRAAYGAATALVYTSRYEGFGLPILEAMACGCPTIACPVASIPEVGGQAVLYVSPDDSGALARAILSCQNSEIRTSLRGLGFAQAKRFSWTTMAAKIEDLLRRQNFLREKTVPYAALASQDYAVSTENPSGPPKQTTTIPGWPVNFKEYLSILTQYQLDSNNSALSIQVGNIRQDLLTFILDLVRHFKSHADLLPMGWISSIWKGEIKEIHDRLRSSDFRYERLNDLEARQLEALEVRLQNLSLPDSERVLYFLAASLFRHAYQLPILLDCLARQGGDAALYSELLLDTPHYFENKGDLDRFQEYTSFIFQKVAQWVPSAKDQEGLVDSRVLENFVYRGVITPLYFSWKTNRYVYCDRAKIVEHVLASGGFPIDFEFPDRPSDRRRIRVGVLKDHWMPGTETYSTLPIIEHFDRDRFEVIAYALAYRGTTTEQLCRSKADQFVVLEQDLASRVNQMRSADLDIVWIGTNVTMVTNHVTLLAPFRLGRVQAISINAPTTTGFRNVDYYVAGELALGKSAASYAESVEVIPGSGLCFSNSDLTTDCSNRSSISRVDWGATQETLVYISGANFNKISPELREIWAQILAHVPNSILVLYPFNPNWQSSYPVRPFRQHMRELLDKYGVDERRLVLIGPLPSVMDIRQCLREADIYLDSVPYGGATSLLDPLEVGVVPVVYGGDVLRFRQALALLTELGLEGLITSQKDEYIAQAIALGCDRAKLTHWQGRLAQAMENAVPFRDGMTYCGHLAGRFEKWIQCWQRERNLVAGIDLNGLQAAIRQHQAFPLQREPLEILWTVRRWLVNSYGTWEPNRLQGGGSTPMGQIYQRLLESGVHYSPLEAEDQAIWQGIVERIQENPTDRERMADYMAAMLYSPPGVLKIWDASERLPTWVFDLYCRFFEPSLRASASSFGL